MGYIWEDYSLDKSYEISTEFTSPYMETWDNESDLVYVNPFYRLFNQLFPKEYLEASSDCEERAKELFNRYLKEDDYKALCNIVLHTCATMDRQKGYTILEALKDIERDRIITGKYGREIQNKFSSLNEAMSKALLTNIVRYHVFAEQDNYWLKSFCEYFRAIEVYYEASTEIIHIYIDEISSTRNLAYADLCSCFLIGLDQRYQITWKNQHFGIINADNTMIIDEMAIL